MHLTCLKPRSTHRHVRRARVQLQKNLPMALFINNLPENDEKRKPNRAMTLGNHSSYDPRWPQSGHYKPIRWEHSTDKAWGPTHSLLGLWLALTNHGPVLFPHPYIVQPRVTQRKGKAVVCGYYCHALCFPLLLLSLLLFWSWAFFKCLLWQFHTCAQIIHPLQILQNLLLPQLHDLFLTHGVCPVLPMCAWVGGHHLNMNLTVFTYHTRRKKKTNILYSSNLQLLITP